MVKDEIVYTYTKEDDLIDFENEENERCCPNCGKKAFKHIKSEGEIVCINCGNVILEKTFGQLGKGTRKGSGGVYNKHP